MTGSNDNNLAEFILTIHNEVQTAVNLLETQVRDNATSEVFLSMGKSTVRVPVFVDVTDDIQTIQDVEVTLDNLEARPGLLVEDLQDGSGIYTKIELTMPDLGSDPNLLGQIEMTFIPTAR